MPKYVIEREISVQEKNNLTVKSHCANFMGVLDKLGPQVQWIIVIPMTKFTCTYMRLTRDSP
jgi:hypothetical protein